ncbi:hypothetical protein [Oceanobacillus alkalisoli]|uniref:hypothetical protein n=1 Tax=Oceanobacillus alkalisoli TaxID=2925113 RepID=UPI001F1195C2|nr:hypothetical protein [Oceanobacillus alkalisoli]MCF3942307.1 hypothetical protein [Oceanobacillus alkalisoli]
MIKNLGKFPQIPLVVIGRDKEYNIRLGMMEGEPEAELRLLEEKWQELIKQQAKLSKNSELIFATTSSHMIHLDRPDVIIGAIHKLILDRDKLVKKCQEF